MDSKTKSMNVLVFNCGSSSLKYRLIKMPDETELSGGEAQRIGPQTSEPSRIIHREAGREETIYAEMKDHGAAFEEILKIMKKNNNKVDVIGHRVVHGAGIFRSHTMIDAEAIKNLKMTEGIAPLHNPPAVRLIEACHKLYPEIPQAAVFDTVFHSTIPWQAKTYALPKWIRRKFGIRKYGFHGTSHKYVAGEAAKYLKKPLDKLNAISCHLGSGGASLCAIINGKSADNTMGYSPLPGLVMSTRSGDIDPALVLQMAIASDGNFNAMEKLLNKESGVLGMSGVSPDIRDIFRTAGKNGATDERLSLTLQVYLWRLKKALGSYLAVTGVPDAVIFTDTIGETVPGVRQEACAGMEAFGIKIDMEKNRNVKKLPADISAPDSETYVLVIATNEELEIARTAAELAA